MQAAMLAKKMAGKKKQAELNASDKTKKMLGQIMDKFASFDTEMKIGTRVSSRGARQPGRAAARRSDISLSARSNDERRRREE